MTKAGAGFGHPLRQIGGQLALYLGLVLLGAMLLAGTLALWVMRLFTPADRHRLMVRHLIADVFRGYLRVLCAVGLMQVDVSELDALNADRSLVIAPNHPSLLDVILVISRLPNVSCIMKSELWDNLFLGAGARWAGYIRNDSPRSMVRLAVENIAQDGHLLVFPEGTRTVTAPVNPLRGSFAVIARRAQVPIQVVFIETNSKFLGKGWPLWKRPEFPLRYRVRLGPRLSAQGSTDAITRQVAACFDAELGPLAARRADVAPMMDSTVDA
jgi:1-acyl-sn-glycerol-3-phosphate acyltransferase